ncbi:MAG TPA: hypothetical protein VGQ99_15200 [Tepidisphaeraceae bacterium]|jgi:hypothetical protein|nr:hypothetical protein [Tepidisphaeraceae bacterium]
MKRSKVLWGLVGLNVFLVIVLSLKLGAADKPAYGNALAGGDYVMAPARITGFNNGVVFVLDTNAGVLSAFSYDNNRKELNAMDPIPLARIFEGGGVGRNPRRP